MSNLLFVCSKNQWRSPTAELLFKNHALHTAKSAGTGSTARIKNNKKLINWANIIYVMERKHKYLLHLKFPDGIKTKEIIVLNIQDKYKFGDPELTQRLKTALAEHL